MYSTSLLEFDKYLLYISEYCQSNVGKLYLETFTPLSDPIFIRNRLSLISDIQKMIVNNFNYNFEQLTDVEEIIETVKTLTYNYDEFKSIIEVIILTNQICKDRVDMDDYHSFKEFISEVSNLPHLERRFKQIFDDEGNVLDNASTELRNIRKRTRNLKERIQQELNLTLQDHQKSTYFQDKIVTKRNDRFVIPVKDNFSYMVEGISHGKSSSGASVYIEPKAVVPLNNELNDLYVDEKEEIFRIFCEFTEMLRGDAESIVVNYHAVRKLDAYFATGLVSNEVMAIAPEITDDNVIELIKARHPLLIIKNKSIKSVIPFDLTLGKDFRLLLLSGPNTGGKSVTLKAVGLNTLMALSGLPIPAGIGSKISLFSSVLADIGDTQSIESSLSTFSGHIENIKQITSIENKNALVLMDEIGSATDPEQGSALAQAILEQLIQKEVLALVTTHYTSLKVFIEDTPHCVNASMQFDNEKHEPTYQFSKGFPGHSFAFEIANRLGLDESIIVRAKELAGSQNVKLTDLLQKMTEEKRKLSENNYQLELKAKLFEMRAKELETKSAELEKDKKILIKRSLTSTQDYLISIQKQINNELTQIKEMSLADKKAKLNSITKTAVTYQNEMTEKIVEIERKPAVNKDLSAGDIVWVNSFDTKATIIEVKKEKSKVDMNGMLFTLNNSDLVKLQEEKAEQPVAVAGRGDIDLSKGANFEINLLGKTFDEAMPLIDEFIDDAMYAGLSKVRIIHGRGTGMLRQKIRNYLKKNGRVKEYYSPPQEAGGDGVTVVSM